MSFSLTEEQTQLLLSLCRAAGAHSLFLAERLMNSSITSHQIDELCELISNEFILNGLEENFESNDYGRRLEYLLDAVNRGRLQ